jgi:hypothetical protein
MKIAIDIDEDYYEIIKHEVKVNHNDFKPYDIIANGTPLPKGHGRLIDADAYLKKICTYKETGCGSCRFQTVCPVDEPAIIDAGEIE